jgi:hypothetical protein
MSNEMLKKKDARHNFYALLPAGRYASCFVLGFAVRNGSFLRFAFCAFIIFLSSVSSLSDQGSDLINKSTFFGSLISPMILSFKISCNKSPCSFSVDVHSAST